MQQLNSDDDVPVGPLWVCYCDFDGVTHFDSVYVSSSRGIHMTAHGHELFEWAPILEQLLQPFPEVEIVLSTSWVRARSLEFAKAQLSPALQARVVGATFDNRVTQKLDFDLMPRGLQVWRDVERRKPTKWFAIDNDDRGWPAWCRDHLIKTEDHLGMSDIGVQDAIRKVLASF